MTVVFFDLETGGIEPERPNIQLAAVAMSDGLDAEVGVFEQKIQFEEKDAAPEALRINCYNPALWKEHAVGEMVAAGTFASFLREHATVELVSRAGKPYRIARLAGHNVASFDCPRLIAMFKRYDLFLPGTAYQPLDTYQRALWYFAERRWTGPQSVNPLNQPANMKLATLAEWFEIPSVGAHDALADVRMCVAIARAMRA